MSNVGKDMLSVYRSHGPRRIAAVLQGAVLCLITLLLPAEAADVSASDLQAALRSLGFLSSLQNRSSISIAVVFNGGDPNAKAQAGRAAAVLSRLNGPGSAAVSASLLAASELPQYTQHLDALFVMPLPPDSGRLVSEFVKRQNVVSISSDPACLEAQSCVLLVQTRSNTTIVLDTALAEAAEAKFATVFKMMVKRR